jgi:hypothetical protein
VKTRKLRTKTKLRVYKNLPLSAQLAAGAIVKLILSTSQENTIE